MYLVITWYGSACTEPSCGQMGAPPPSGSGLIGGGVITAERPAPQFPSVTQGSGLMRTVAHVSLSSAMMVS